MNKFIHKDNNNRKIFYRVENQNFIKKVIFHNSNIKNSFKLKSNFELFNSVNSNLFKVSLNSRCVLTGRSSKIAKNLNFSRISFLRLARSGCVPGLHKYSW